MLCKISSLFFVFVILMTTSFSGQAEVLETMTDRCSEDVVISRRFDNTPRDVGGIILKRNTNGWTEWSEKMPINGSTWIRWWCNSTTGNRMDPGTWRIKGVSIGTRCHSDWDQGNISSCHPTASIDLESSVVDGRTAERSRCASNRTKSISARLGPNRLLEIRCHDNKQNFTIKPAHSGLCLDIEYGAVQPYLKLQQDSCNGQSNQRFRFIKKNEMYEIRVVRSNQCLAVKPSNNTGYQLIRQWPCDNSPSQRFQIVRYGNQLEIKAPGTEKCWDIRGGSTNTEANVQLYSCHGGVNQRFYFEQR